MKTLKSYEKYFENITPFYTLEDYKDYLKNHNINSFLNDDETPLTYAIMNSDKRTVQYLLENGADPNLPNDMKVYPIELAIDYCEYDMVLDLIQHNVKLDINIENDMFDFDINISSVLVIALIRNCKHIFHLLMKNGMEIDFDIIEIIKSIKSAFNNFDAYVDRAFEILNIVKDYIDKNKYTEILDFINLQKIKKQADNFNI